MPDEGRAVVESPATDKRAPVEVALREIRIPQFCYRCSSSPADPINQLIDWTHPHGVAVKLEAAGLSVTSVYYDSARKPRYSLRYDYPSGAHFRSHEKQMADCSALDALQAVCGTFGLGYRMTEDAVEIVDADAEKADWAVFPRSAAQVAEEHSDFRTAAGCKGKLYRVTGGVSGFGRGLDGSRYFLMEGGRFGSSWLLVRPR